jgi:hypothetical protein
MVLSNLKLIYKRQNVIKFSISDCYCIEHEHSSGLLLH